LGWNLSTAPPPPAAAAAREPFNAEGAAVEEVAVLPPRGGLLSRPGAFLGGVPMPARCRGGVLAPCLGGVMLRSEYAGKALSKSI
jgi:hypothetical protein